jgi:Zn ribbon nucleic-acid-binding protein
MAVFDCPECGHSQIVDDKHIGKTATCPQCRARGTVAEAMESTVPSSAECPAEPTVRKREGEPLGISGFLENDDSSLKREWVVIDDPRMTVRFDDVYGVTTKYDSSRSSEYSRSYL